MGPDIVQRYEGFGEIFCIHIQAEPVQTTYRIGGQEEEIIEYNKHSSNLVRGKGEQMPPSIFFNLGLVYLVPELNNGK
jgi:hypothetical protein